MSDIFMVGGMKMIKFEGTVSDNVRSSIKKKEQKVGVLIAAILFVLFGGAVVAISLLTDLIVLLFLILVAVFSVMLMLPQKGIEKRLPTEVTVENEEIIFSAETGGKTARLSDVKRVYDKGDWYEIEFYFPHKYIYAVCEKKLITAGTLEEFEALFKDKMVKK